MNIQDRPLISMLLRRVSSHAGIILVVLALLFAAGCSGNLTESEKEEITEELLKGESDELGDGTTNVWAMMFTGRDSLTFSIGLNIPMNVLSDAQQDVPDTVSLNFPDEVRDNTAVQFVRAVWPYTINGSEPLVLARFFVVNQDQAGTMAYPTPTTVSDTIRLGVHQSELVFYELLIRQSTLLQQQDTPLQIPQPENALVPEVIPTEFFADFQEEQGRYAMTWNGLDASP